LAGNQTIPGIHHVTAIAGYPQQNIDFYGGVLGLRLVKLTVNYDDPGTYHLYYGDGLGHPGTILTFFPWPGAPLGIKGTGQLTVISFSAPEGSMDYWKKRLSSHGITITEQFSKFGEKKISFQDTNGLQLELVESNEEDRKGWAEGPIPPEKAIRGFYSVTLTEEGFEKTAELLVDTLKFREKTREGDTYYRYEMGEGGPGSIVDVVCEPGRPRGIVSVGTVHHVAWRTPTDEEQKRWHDTISNTTRLNVTPIIDRKYFHSIYFREPGGVLFEIATDPPGFNVDEPVERLGSELQLPARLEPMRMKLEQLLPPVRVPKKSIAR